MTTLSRAIFQEAPPREAVSQNAALAIKRFSYGAGSALLMFAGADATSDAGTEAWTSFDVGSIDSIARSFLDGPLHGPMQIAAAVAVFLAAGKCLSRVAGLAAIALLMTLHARGVTVNDVVAFFEHFYLRLDTAAAAFLNADV